MSQDMHSQGPDEEVGAAERPSTSHHCTGLASNIVDDIADDDEDNDYDYYNYDAEDGGGDGDAGGEADPEYFQYDLLRVEDAERLLNENVEALCQAIKVGLCGNKVMSLRYVLLLLLNL